MRSRLIYQIAARIWLRSSRTPSLAGSWLGFDRIMTGIRPIGTVMSENATEKKVLCTPVTVHSPYSCTCTHISVIHIIKILYIPIRLLLRTRERHRLTPPPRIHPAARYRWEMIGFQPQSDQNPTMVWSKSESDPITNKLRLKSDPIVAAIGIAIAAIIMPDSDHNSAKI